MSCYATIQDVKDLGTLPESDIDLLEKRSPGITLRIATRISGNFDSRLMKRYAAPFQEPYPDALVDAVARVVAWRLLLRRGFNPSSEQDTLVKEEKDEALAWVKEAADSKEGLVELPLRQTSAGEGSAVNAGGPLGYSEQSPYTWMTLQAKAARYER
jgi:phage gp36-like protein